MTRTNSMLIRWRVQVRKSRAHKWVNKSGLFETRSAARAEQKRHQAEGYFDSGYCQVLGYGFGNTRVVRHEGRGKV